MHFFLELDWQSMLVPRSKQNLFLMLVFLGVFSSFMFREYLAIERHKREQRQGALPSNPVRAEDYSVLFDIERKLVTRELLPKIFFYGIASYASTCLVAAQLSLLVETWQ